MTASKTAPMPLLCGPHLQRLALEAFANIGLPLPTSAAARDKIRAVFLGKASLYWSDTVSHDAETNEALARVLEDRGRLLLKRPDGSLAPAWADTPASDLLRLAARFRANRVDIF
jgi:hypothetical protein